MNFSNQKGNIIAYVIIAMTTIAALAVGALYMTSSSALGELGANNLNKAYFLALAGKDYALIKNLENTGTGGRNFTLANGDIFSLVISGNNITSTGIVNIGTPFEARRIISIIKTGFGSQPDISFAKDIQSFTTPAESKTGFITTDTSTGQISLGKIGSSWQSSFGALWYGGSAVQGNCQNGQCAFGTGFRAFFVFQFAPGSFGDGFTFAIFNGTDNDLYSVGGHQGIGELLAYAGSSFVSEGNYLDNNRGNGIQPPKMAIEFDIYKNSGCPSGAPCSSDTRCDGSDGRDHMAYVFWGDNTRMCGGFGTTAGQKTYDDNQHSAGSGGVSEPQNALTTDPNSYFSGSSWGSNWLKSATVYAIRIEVTRSLTENSPGSGRFDYTINSWVKVCPDLACQTYSNGDFGNTKVAYAADAPTIKRTVMDGNQIILDNEYHNKFSKFLFGWTTATSGVTQNVTLSQFKMNFVK